MVGSQDYIADPRNENALIYLNGALVPRAQALVSIFDAGFALGDGVWEGIRLHHGKFLFLVDHINRLFAGAAAIKLNIGLDPAGISAALHQLVQANNMRHGVHLRLMVTRGPKATVNQDPRNALGKSTIAITAEYKAPPDALAAGLHLATSNIRCSPDDIFDMRLNSHSRLNLIRALLQAIELGADEALMLDPHGQVSSCNATNFFCVRQGQLFTSSGAYCFNGITRAKIIALCQQHAIPLHCGDFTLHQAQTADEAFVTGTMGGITPVRRIDAHNMPASPGPITQKLQRLYSILMDEDAA